MPIVSEPVWRCKDNFACCGVLAPRGDDKARPRPDGQGERDPFVNLEAKTE